MIGYSCTNCGHTCSVQDEYSGKRIKCPKCYFVGVVVDDSGRIQIICQNCGNENNVPETLADNEIKCPKCNNTVVAAFVEKEPAESADNDLQEKKPPKPKKSEISEHSLLVIISATAAVIVVGLIIIGAVTASYRSRRARKSEELQSRQQVNNTQPTEQIVQKSRKDTLRRRYPKSRRNPVKWEKKLTIVCVIATPCIVLLFFWIYWCPKCRKMWAMKRISPFFNLGGHEFQCKYCGNIMRIRKGH
ncbi:MAG: hypothetical protein GY774_30495 [Planctomycetes bacterium]|nr:hypothetical protein [Planctomycetota bacterium]